MRWSLLSQNPPCSKHLPAIKNWRCKLPSTHSFGQRRTHSILAYPPNVYDTFPDRVDEITARVVAFSYGDWFLDLPRLSYRSYMYTKICTPWKQQPASLALKIGQNCPKKEISSSRGELSVSGIYLDFTWPQGLLIPAIQNSLTFGAYETSPKSWKVSFRFV